MEQTSWEKIIQIECVCPALSGISLIALIVSAIIIFLIVRSGTTFDVKSPSAIAAAAIAIIITALVAASASISNDTIQDLKAGQMVGATPWKQQVMLMIGVVVAAFVIPLILQLLFDAYGMVGVMPRSGMDPSQMLLAPQASLMAAVVKGIFLKDINIALLVTGAIIAVLGLIADKLLAKRGWRMPVLAVGLGIYLPVDTSSPLVIGGILSWWVSCAFNKRLANLPEDTARETRQEGYHYGLLLASGLVAGAAITGVILAVPFVIEGTTNALRIMPKHVRYVPQVLGLLTTAWLCYWFRSRILREATVTQ